MEKEIALLVLTIVRKLIKKDKTNEALKLIEAYKLAIEKPQTVAVLGLVLAIYTAYHEQTKED